MIGAEYEKGVMLCNAFYYYGYEGFIVRIRK